ncbi:hypothetical protein FRE64_13505 [Euhalothece natronophila Z-M001]|uniref:Uncharacterized protein n=1 Tax=Euhalothece natronophila Z-M001 TaxID=522448 RepID=A0A5B8NRF0_9CHRO|nr:hypothetical protein [Euhalothece natronophila]QDZ40869.1 hypothetical protein FRE64_13505 [Euhalothece natronophila Z-M001]
MKINLNNDQQIIKEAFQILSEKLEPSKLSRFWTICDLGSGDYSQLKDKLFAEETVDSLSDKIKAQEAKTEN